MSSTAPVAATAAAAGTARPHIWTMAVTHQAFRREFELAPRIVRDIAPGDEERTRQAAEWFAMLLWFMRHHHENEDLLMYPLLTGTAPQELLDRMERQHQALAAAIDLVQERLPRWSSRDVQSAADLAAALDAMLPILIEHVDAEELEIMPWVADQLTAEEYARQGTRGNKADPRTLMMTFGAVVEQASPAEGDVMLAYPPEGVRRAWHEHGEADYRRMMTLLRGGLQPRPRHPAPPGQALDDHAAAIQPGR